MEIDTVPILGTTVDKSQVPPIHQKRILAFVNHFITNTCSFLNEFIAKCENKFIDLERKLQRVEASLIIIESKLASIPGMEAVKESVPQRKEEISRETAAIEATEEPSTPETSKEPIEPPATEQIGPEKGVAASDDTRYRKYFKMLQFGVPHAAVKLKMSAEGYDPDVLDTPSKILLDGVRHEIADDR